MKSSKLWLSLLASLLLAGCATGGNSRSSKSISKEAKVYTKAVDTKSVVAFKGKVKCPKTLKNEDHKNWKRLVAMANSCVSKANYATTEKIAKVLSSKHHLSPWGAYYHSLVAESRGQSLRALWMVDLALKKAPNNGILLFQKARLLWNEKQATAAIALFEEAVKESSDLIEAHMILARVYFRDQDFDKAEKHFEAVAKNDKRNLDAFIGLAECQLEDDQPSKAAENLERAIKLSPKALDLRMRQARILENEVENVELALKKYKEIYRLGKRKKLDQPVTKNLSDTIRRLETKLSQASPGEQVSKRGPAKEGVKE